MTEERIIGCIKETVIDGKTYKYCDLKGLIDDGYDIESLPFSIRMLLESALRQYDGKTIRRSHVETLLHWQQTKEDSEVAFMPSRVLLQDFTGVPAVVDLAAMRDAVAGAGLAPETINPVVPVDLVIDHSVMVDAYGSPEALAINLEKEYERNKERYRFLKWAGKAFDNFRVIPPGTGIIHQVNLEYLATVATVREKEDENWLYPDTLVGTDSHTTMINGLGVLGWGVGGIEAEAAMLGQPIYLTKPEVVGVRLTGRLKEGTTATDLALTVTAMLRKENVVGKFVEFFGEGADGMTLADRATVANMAPEYGATMGYFPVDEQSLDYLRKTGRDEAHVVLTETYLKKVGLFNGVNAKEPQYTKVVELDLSTVEASLAGPKRPQDKVPLTQLKESFENSCSKAVQEGGFGLSDEDMEHMSKVSWTGRDEVISHGAVVLAAITSCTNTSNPGVMLGAGLIAKKAVSLGMTVPGYVKTSLTPGSRVVTDYLNKAGLLKPLEALGFHVAGYGCATCIGNSGPLAKPVEEAIQNSDLTVASVLSGNRNFEGRIHQHIKANYLASPMLVVLYALAGTVRRDLNREAVGEDSKGRPVYLKDLWPSSQEIDDAMASAVTAEDFRHRYMNGIGGDERFERLEAPEGKLYRWDKTSTYIQAPTFFNSIKERVKPFENILGARALAVLGNSVTTDHISPAGLIPVSSPAGRYLKEKDVSYESFNSYGSRRGNHEVMMRGTFANVRIRNGLVPGVEGGFSRVLPNGEAESIYDVAQVYRKVGIPLIVIAGKEYGTGSSRDWAAKGTWLLGVKAVLAESYERIHRSNLVGMGVLPLQFVNGQSADSLGLKGTENFSIEGLEGEVTPGKELRVRAVTPDGKEVLFNAKLRLDSHTEIEYYLNGGILHTLIRKMI